MAAPRTFEITLADLREAIRRWVERLNHDQQLTVPEYLEVGRLWNTVQANRPIAEEPEPELFLELVRREIPKMVAALNMVAGRAMGLVSSEHDFVLGGILEKRFQYQITDP
jgi:hypothetical protein